MFNPLGNLSVAMGAFSPTVPHAPMCSAGYNALASGDFVGDALPPGVLGTPMFALLALVFHWFINVLPAMASTHINTLLQQTVLLGPVVKSSFTFILFVLAGFLFSCFALPIVTITSLAFSSHFEALSTVLRAGKGVFLSTKDPSARAGTKPSNMVFYAEKSGMVVWDEFEHCYGARTAYELMFQRSMQLFLACSGAATDLVLSYGTPVAKEASAVYHYLSRCTIIQVVASVCRGVFTATKKTATLAIATAGALTYLLRRIMTTIQSAVNFFNPFHRRRLARLLKKEKKAAYKARRKEEKALDAPEEKSTSALDFIGSMIPSSLLPRKNKLPSKSFRRAAFCKSHRWPLAKPNSPSTIGELREAYAKRKEEEEEASLLYSESSTLNDEISMTSIEVEDSPTPSPAKLSKRARRRAREAANRTSDTTITLPSDESKSLSAEIMLDLDPTTDPLLEDESHLSASEVTLANASLSSEDEVALVAAANERLDKGKAPLALDDSEIDNEPSVIVEDNSVFDYALAGIDAQFDFEPVENHSQIAGPST